MQNFSRWFKFLKFSGIFEKCDGFGYDIRSFENGKEIYIEVKNNQSRFSLKFIFTKRELDVMKKYNSQYYLYRIFNFDEVENTGLLYIFRGEGEIISYFDFNPTVYKLEAKSGT